MSSIEERPEFEPAELALIGTVRTGRVIAVFRWGVIVDLGLSRLGFVDPLYIDDGDVYTVGQTVEGELSSLEDGGQKFWVRPLDQIPLGDRYRSRRQDLSRQETDSDDQL
jgi:hypothetical protein